jgi:hypothetical protein
MACGRPMKTRYTSVRSVIGSCTSVRVLIMSRGINCSRICVKNGAEAFTKKNPLEIDQMSYGQWFELRHTDLSKAGGPGSHLSILRTGSGRNGSDRSVSKGPSEGSRRSGSKGPTPKNLGVGAPSGGGRSRSKSKGSGSQRKWNSGFAFAFCLCDRI